MVLGAQMVAALFVAELVDEQLHHVLGDASRRCWAMMASALRSLVSRNVAIGGGTVAAIRAMIASEMTPGPLGMAEMRPRAEAPLAMAIAASAGDLMQ